MNPIDISRRAFLKMAGLAGASLALPRWVVGQNATSSSEKTPARPGRRFEVIGSIYPWDVQGEGIEVVLDNLTSLAGVNTIYLISLMHKEYRPKTSIQFPHNPIRPHWNAEDSCIYFHSHLELYGRIKPAISQYEWLSSTDWLKVVIDAARARGLKVGAEISHTPIPSSVCVSNPEFMQCDVNGKQNPKSLHRACPNHPDVREYLLALFGDLADNYQLDYIQTCMYLYSADACFCRSCQREAQAAGFDLAAAIPVLKANPKAQPQLNQWLDFKRKTNARIYRLVAERIHKAKGRPEFRVNGCYYGKKEDHTSGLYIEDVRGVIDSNLIPDHTEQNGKAKEDFSVKKAWLARNRSLLGPETTVVSSVAVRPKATPDLVRKGVELVVKGGGDGVHGAHYDCATFSLLRAMREGLAAAGVKGFIPVRGVEAGKMTLTNWVRETYLDEACIRASSGATAVSKFAFPSGSYDIIVSYAGIKDEPGFLALSVAGSEKLAWKWDPGLGTWKRKVIPQVTLQSGEEINLTGSPGAHVEFVEFVEHEAGAKPS